MTAITKKRAGGRLKGRNNQLQLLVLIAPAILIKLLFHYLPMFGLVIAFEDFNIVRGVFRSEWVGFENFDRFFSGIYAWRVIRNTLLINVFSILFEFPLPILFALALNEIKDGPFKRVSQTISYLPHFISTVILVGIIKILFASNGVVNVLVRALGGKTTLFLSKPEWFRPLYIFSDVWQHLGWNAIIYMAALAGVDMSLYEAAEIDGANRLQKIVHISLPSILPVVTTMFILRLSSILGVGFEKVYLMYNQSVYETADVISTYLYRKSFESSYPDYGLSTAIGMISSIVGGIFVFIGNSTVKKMNGSSLI